MPENAVYVGRPTRWGNPFRAVLEGEWWYVKDGEGNYWDAAHRGKDSAVRVCVRLYRAWIEGKIGIEYVDLAQLKGKNLACFCKEDEPCHADVLLELANKP